MTWGEVAPFVALVITLVGMQAAVVLTTGIRKHDFYRYEDRSRKDFARQFPLPPVDQSPAEQRRKALSPFVEKVHNTANAAQTTYHNAVVRSAGCLVLAFTGLVLGA